MSVSPFEPGEGDATMTIVIAAGGTGGHVYPALALAEEFRRQDPDAAVTFVGTGKRLESMILGMSACPVETLDVQGVVGRGGRAVAALAQLPRAIGQAMQLLRRGRADVVIGTGGYVSPPVIVAAWLLGIARVLVEPNAMPGLANRLLAPLAHRIFLAFDGAQAYFPRGKTCVVGTPLRQAFLEEPPSLPERVKTLFVCGGSQGSRAINDAMVAAVRRSRAIRDTIDVIHQTGVEDYERVQQAYREVGGSVQVVPFVSAMPAVLRQADAVVARAGAGTLAELAAWGKPALLIPFPHATHDHQEKNAREVEAAGAAIVIPQSELTGQRLAQEIEALMNDSVRLQRMAACSLARRRTDATQRVVTACRQLVGQRVRGSAALSSRK